MEDEINLLDYWRAITKYKWFIITSVFLATVISIIVAKRLPNIYQADATIMPYDQGGSSSLLSSLGGGVGALISGSIGESSGGKTQLMTILSSRTLTRDIINQNQNKILTTLYPKLWDPKTHAWKTKDPKDIPPLIDISENLLSHLKFVDDPKKPTLIIKAEFKDPSFAADIVNLYIDALTQYLNTNTLTNAQKNRAFIESSLEQKSKELLEAGKELAKFYETNVISKVGSLIDVDTHLVRKPASKTNNIVKNVPQQIYLQYLTEQRATLSAVTNLLATEYEKAKIEENKENLAFQVIDKADIPSHKIKPNRRQIVELTFVISLFLSIFISIVWEHIKKIGD